MLECRLWHEPWLERKIQVKTALLEKAPIMHTMRDNRRDLRASIWRIRIMVAKKMWRLTIIIKKNDQLKGRKLYSAILDYMIKVGILGATVLNAVDGFGRRGRSTLHIEGISINYPLVIEVIEEPDKLLPLLPDIKQMVDDNGVMTYQEVFML